MVRARKEDPDGVAVIPGVFAMSRNAGPISNILGGRNSESTIWQALQASRCERMPGREITVLRFRTERRYSQAAAPSTTAHLWHMAVLFPNRRRRQYDGEPQDAAQRYYPNRDSYDDRRGGQANQR